MRAFLVTCLLGLAWAAPQGYNYQTGQQQQTATLNEQHILQMALQAPKLQQLLSGAGQTIFQQPQQQSLQLQQQQQQFHQQALQLPTNFANNLFPQQTQSHQQLQNHLQSQYPGQYQPQYQRHSGAATISKDIYVHVPPAEEPEEQYVQPALPAAPPRKHYRIVFIKAPTPSVTKTALRIKQAPVEEKTIIYVLTKKPDPLDLQAALAEAAPKQISKPEVFFIKYKTQEEAVHAQRTIQAQYDQLGGTTQVSDEGVAPVTSVIGALDGPKPAPANIASNSIGNGQLSAIPNKYLPAHLRT